MNIKTLLMVATGLLLATNLTRADDFDYFRYDPNSQSVFPNNQVQVDAFGTYASRDRFGSAMNRWGSGLGVDYFPIKYLGIGADSYLQEFRWPYRVNGSGIIRLPLEFKGVGLALYGFGGGGREFKYAPQWTYHGGGGIEFKLNRYVGIFSDYRRVFPDQTPDYNLVRAGINFGF